MSQDNITSIYYGDLEKLKKEMNNKDGINIYTINNLVHAKGNEEYRIDLISLILKAEADNCGQFLRYKNLIDFIVQKKGISSVIFSWQNPAFFKYTKVDSSTVQTNLTVPVSNQMNTYLHHLEVRENEDRKRTAKLLNDIDEKTKYSNTKTRKAIRLTKRQIVKNYRLLNPKSIER